MITVSAHVTLETVRQALAANLVADGARAARSPGGQCAVCRHPVRAGERVADLTGGRGVAHVAGCVAGAGLPAPAARRPAARSAP